MGFAKGFNQVEALTEKAVRSIVEEHGYSLWDVVFIKEGASWYLRILIDKAGGVSIGDCESIDGLINAKIDEQPFIDKIDYLEVSSAGLERPIRRIEQIHNSVGKKIRLKTYKLCEGLPEKDVKCVLKGFDGESVEVSGDFGEIRLLLSDISSMNYDDFDDCDEIITEV